MIPRYFRQFLAFALMLMATIVAPQSLYAQCATPPTGMVAWWSLDETVGPTANDIAGSVNNAGTWMSSPVPATGKVAGALTFNGSNSVDVPNQAELGFGTGDFSIDLWIKTTNASGTRTILDKRVFSGTYKGYVLFLSNGYLGSQIGDGAGYNNWVTTGFVADGNWHHIAVTVDRDNATGWLHYVDGVAVGPIAGATAFQGSLTNTAPFVMGRNLITPSQTFAGTLDEIELFNRVLDPAEIQSIWAAGSAGKCKTAFGAILDDSILTINGTSGPDSILLRLNSTGDTIQVDNQETTVYPDYAFQLTLVNGIHICTGDGDDWVVFGHDEGPLADLLPINADLGDGINTFIGGTGSYTTAQIADLDSVFGELNEVLIGISVVRDSVETLIWDAVRFTANGSEAFLQTAESFVSDAQTQLIGAAEALHLDADSEIIPFGNRFPAKTDSVLQIVAELSSFIGIFADSGGNDIIEYLDVLTDSVIADSLNEVRIEQLVQRMEDTVVSFNFHADTLEAHGLQQLTASETSFADLQLQFQQACDAFLTRVDTLSSTGDSFLARADLEFVDGGDTLLTRVDAIAQRAIELERRCDSLSEAIVARIGGMFEETDASLAKTPPLDCNFETTNTIKNAFLMFGTNNNDLMIGGPGTNFMWGRGGSDRMYGRDGMDFMWGNEGIDDMYGEGGMDFMWGNEGNDCMYGGDGTDFVCGNTGDDYVNGDAGSDLLFGNENNDKMYGGDATDIMLGNQGIDEMYGDAGTDIMLGNEDGDKMYGGDATDIMCGNTGNDEMHGDAGADIMSGNEDGDKMYGGDGNDIMLGNQGIDEMHGDAGTDIMLGNEDGDKMYGGDATDIMCGNTGNDEMHGDAGSDILWGNENDDIISGDDGNDLIWGNQGKDLINGYDGNDVISGNQDDDYLRGGAGNDIICGNQGDDEIYGDDGNDLLWGNDNNDEMHGGIGNDIMFGNHGIDTMYGDAGNDAMSGGQDNDWMSGGDGNDAMLGGEGNDEIYGDAGIDLLCGNENDDKLSGGEGNDALFGNDGTDWIDGNNGNDAMWGNRGPDRMDGGNGNDAMWGNEDNDIMYGSPGVDWMSGNEGVDCMDGGTDNDWMWGNQDGDFMFGSPGVDLIFGNQGNDCIDGGDDRDLIFGNEDNDNLLGVNGTDYMFGNAGDDCMDGGADNDRMWGNDGNDIILGRDGDDKMFGDRGDDKMDGGNGNDWMFGNRDNDVMYGGYGNDWMWGNAGNDNMYGGPDNDHMWGGSGSGNTDQDGAASSGYNCPTCVGTITITKNTIGGNGTFSYTGSFGSFTITTINGTGSKTFTNIAAGNYMVTELGQSLPWAFASLACKDPDGGTTVNGQTANIDLDPGESIACTYTNTKHCVPPPSGMVAWWPLDETAGTTSKDIAGAVNNSGTWKNSPAPVTGMVDGALSFDGLNSVDVPDQAELNFGTGDFSVDLWIKTTDATESPKTILDKRVISGTYKGFVLFLYNGCLSSEIGDGVGYNNWVTTGFVADGNWHHIAVTVDRDNPSGWLHYVDGNVVGPIAGATAFQGSLTNTAPLVIGRNLLTPSHKFTGALDEIELFNRVLDSLEIYTLWAADNLGKCKQDTSYIPGDPNHDGGIDISDAVYLIAYIFSGGSAPIPLIAGDANCDGMDDISDVVYLIAYIFSGGHAPCSGSYGKLSPDGELLQDSRSVYSATLKLAENETTNSSTKTSAVEMHTDAEVAGVQLEFKTDISKADEIVAQTTERSKNLRLFSGVVDGSFKVGLVDLTGKNAIAAGDGPIVNFDFKGDRKNLDLVNGVVCDRNGKRLNVKIDQIVKASALPKQYGLSQNYPNPFNPSTEIRFALPKSCEVRVEVLNVLGQTVRTLTSGLQTAGTHFVTWDGTDERGNSVASGVYFYRIVSDEFTTSRKMILLK